MESQSEQKVRELFRTISPWFDPGNAFIFDLAKEDWGARLAIANALLESDKEPEAVLVLESIVSAPPSENSGNESARIRAYLELADLRIEQLKYAEAEDLLWKARNEYAKDLDLEFFREDISLLIAQCRFGQGFVQEAIDRAEEILHKLRSLNADAVKLAKTHQQLGWYYSHKADAETSLKHLKQAMELAPSLDRELVDEGLEAERTENYEKAIEHYFDSIRYDS